MNPERTRDVLRGMIESLWLTAVLLVPLTFAPPAWLAQFDVPKVALARLLSFALVGLWLVDGAIVVATAGSPSLANLGARLRAWLSAHPPRLVVIGAFALLATVAISAAASPFDALAIRGVEVGSDGQSLLAVASASAFFFAIALRLRTERQAWRLAWAIAATTVLASAYAVTQAVGLDPFGVSGASSGTADIVGSLGDPTSLGSAVLLGLPMLFAVGLRYSSRLSMTAVGSTAGVVVAALLLAESRGPLLGLILESAVLALLLHRHLTTSQRRLALASVLLTIVVAIALVGLASVLDQPDAGPDAEIQASAGDVVQTADSDLLSNPAIWRSSISLAWERPWFDSDDGIPGLVSGLIGYGPESFRYVFPLRVNASDAESISFTSHARNQYLHSLVELGLLGLLASLAVTLFPVLLGAWFLLRRPRRYSWQLNLLAGAIVAALAGRLVEQTFGVAHLSDALLAWASLGLLVALPTGDDEVATARERFLRWPVAALAGIVVVGVLALLVGLASTQIIDPLRAARDASLSSSAADRDDADASFELMLAALERTPSVERYRDAVVSLLTDTRASGVSLADERRITESTVALLLDGVLMNPYSAQMSSLLGVEQLILAEMSGAEPDDALATFQRTVDLLPGYWQAKRIFGVALVRSGRLEEAVPVLTVALESAPEPLTAELLLYRARALAALDRTDEATADLLQATTVASDQLVLFQIERELERLTQ